MEVSESRVLYRYRNRQLTASDLEEIRSVVAEHYERGRSFIARTLCERWDWRQANGRLKAMACRDLLLRLEENGHLRLPPRISEKNNQKRKRFLDLPLFPAQPLQGLLRDFGALRVRPVETQGEKETWDSLVQAHHYLGYRPVVGERLKYLAFLGEDLVGCVGWGSAAFKCAVRDDWIGWTTAQRKSHLCLVANNVRFLVLPWVRIPHLASKVLGTNLRRLCADWVQAYGHPLYLAETFVDTSRFRGTCYRAANWRFLGQTAGLSKRGNAYHPHGNPKAVLVYPLDPKFREKLCGGVPSS
jgi:hypothetical protein